MSATDWKAVFFSAEGRLARKPFWGAAALLLAILVLYNSVAGLTLRLVTGWMMYPILIFCGVCVLSKRLHDRGRSGWYAAPVIIALTGAEGPWRGVDIIFVAILAWAAVELGVLTGEQGANRFGVNPGRPARA